MNFIASLEPQVVMYILSSISEGLTALGKYSLKKIRRAGGVVMVTGCVCVLDTMVCTGCCSSLDHIVTYLFKQLSRSTKKRPAPMATDDRFLHIMQQHPEMIQQVGDQRQTPHPTPPTRVCCLNLTVVVVLQMLSTVLNIIIFEDCRNQWSMSRPLLGLILLNEKVNGGGGGRERLPTRASVTQLCSCSISLT